MPVLRLDFSFVPNTMSDVSITGILVMPVFFIGQTC